MTIESNLADISIAGNRLRRLKINRTRGSPRLNALNESRTDIASPSSSTKYLMF